MFEKQIMVNIWQVLKSLKHTLVYNRYMVVNKVATKTVLYSVKVSTQEFDSCNIGSIPIRAVHNILITEWIMFHIMLCKSHAFVTASSNADVKTVKRVISSVVEHSPHKRNVTGSIPVWPIKINKIKHWQIKNTMVQYNRKEKIIWRWI